MDATQAAPPEIDLRARILTALTTTPCTDEADPTAYADRPWHVHGAGHKFHYLCALCGGDVETLADAVLAAIGGRNVDQATARIAEAVRHAKTCGSYTAVVHVDQAEELLAAVYLRGEPCDGERCESGGGAHCHRCPEAESSTLLAERDRLRAELAAWHDRESADAAAGSYAGRAETAEAERDAALARIDALREVPGRLRQMAVTPEYIDMARSRALSEAADLVDTALIDTAANPLAEPDDDGYAQLAASETDEDRAFHQAMRQRRRSSEED